MQDLSLLYNLELRSGAGPLQLGMTRNKVKNLIGPPDETLASGMIYERDIYHELGIMLEYHHEPQECNGIYFGRPAELMYRDRDLLKMPYQELLQWAVAQDPNVDYDAEGFTSHALQLSVSSRLGYIDDEFVDVVDSVMVFSRDYWPDREETEREVNSRLEASITEQQAQDWIQNFLSEP